MIWESPWGLIEISYDIWAMMLGVCIFGIQIIGILFMENFERRDDV
jgi:hypothetical protein